MTDRIEQARELAVEVAIALMLISGVTPLAGFDVGIEHVPYGLAVAVLVGKRPPLSFAVVVGAASVFWTLSHFYWGDWGNWVYLVQFTNVLTPLVFFATLRPKLERTARVVFWAYIVFALLQWFRLIAFAEPVFENLIPRFRAGREDGFRGVASLETEPARAAFQMLMLYVIARAKFRSQPVALGALLFTQVILLRATTGLMLTAAMIGLLVIAEVRQRPKLTPLLLIGALIVGIGSYTVNPKIRLIADTTVDRGFDGFVDTMTATSGGRWLALGDSIEDIVTQPFGRGADPAYGGTELELVEEELFETADGDTYKIERSARPVSAILNAVRTFGVAMAVLVAWAVRREMFDGRRPKLNAYFWFVILCGFLYGPSGSEALLIALGVAGSHAVATRPAVLSEPVPSPV